VLTNMYIVGNLSLIAAVKKITNQLNIDKVKPWLVYLTNSVDRTQQRADMDASIFFNTFSLVATLTFGSHFVQNCRTIHNTFRSIQTIIT